MAWQWNDGVRDCQNLLHTSGAQSIWALLNLRRNHGWSFVDSDDASGNTVTHDGTGANGLDNADAWIWVRCPDGRREELYIRGSSHYIWMIQYSSKAGFPGPAPHPSPPNVTTDEVSLIRGRGAARPIGDGAQRDPENLFPSSGSWYCHCACQDSSSGVDVYPYWMFVGEVAGFEQTTFICDSIDTTNLPSGDEDNAVFYCSDDRPVYSNLNSYYDTDQFYGFMLKDDATESWDALSADNYSSNCNGLGINPHFATPRHHFRRVFLYRDTSASSPHGEKGELMYCRWSSDTAAYTYTDIVDDNGSSDIYVVNNDLWLPGWHDNAVMPSV